MTKKRLHKRRYKAPYEINGQTRTDLKRIAFDAMVTAFGSEQRAHEWIQWLAEGGMEAHVAQMSQKQTTTALTGVK